jgi:hypothetical protein
MEIRRTRDANTLRALLSVRTTDFVPPEGYFYDSFRLSEGATVRG